MYMLNYDIETLLTSHGIKIEKKSSSQFMIKCLNPSHEDSTPSFSIRRSDGVFFCFGCGVKGGPDLLYKYITGESLHHDQNDYFRTSTRPPVKKSDVPPEIKVQGKLLDPLTNPEIRAWLYKYGIENDNFIRDREVTYAKYAEIWAVPDDDSIELEPTVMYNRICSPIYHEGNLINYEGRTFNDSKPKVIYVKNGTMKTLYNWQYLDLTKDVVVVEGVKGLWRVWNVEPNVVAMFHAIPSEKQLEMLRQVKGNIIVFRDNDKAGERSIKALNKGLGREIKVCYDKRVTKDGKGYDPNDCTSIEIENHLKNAIVYIDPDEVVTEDQEPQGEDYTDLYFLTNTKR